MVNILESWSQHSFFAKGLKMLRDIRKKLRKGRRCSFPLMRNSRMKSNNLGIGLPPSHGLLHIDAFTGTSVRASGPSISVEVL